MFRGQQGNLIGSGLFLEFGNGQYAIYTTSEVDKIKDGKTYPSLYKIYMDMSDVTEYNFANAAFESYQHWDMISKLDQMKPIIDRWRKELELKIKSKALANIMAQAEDGDPKKRLEANKFLYEKIYIGDRSTKGRPSKAQVKEAAEKQFKEQQAIQTDYERLLQ